VAAGKTLAIEGHAEGVENSARELKIATVVDGHNMPTVPFSLSLKRRLRERAVAARPAGAIQNDPRTTGAVCGEPS